MIHREYVPDTQVTAVVILHHIAEIARLYRESTDPRQVINDAIVQSCSDVTPTRNDMDVAIRVMALLDHGVLP